MANQKVLFRCENEKEWLTAMRDALNSFRGYVERKKGVSRIITPWAIYVKDY